MAKAKRARKVETLKQPSLCLRLRAPYFYPDIYKSGSERGVKLFYMAEYCDTLQSKEKRNWEHKACLNDRALRLLDHNVTWKSGCFPAPERGDISKNSDVFLKLNVKLSITHKYLKPHYTSDRMICPF
jgi:hypothetical protein